MGKPRSPGAWSLFLVISPQTQRILYVGEAVQATLGYDAAAFLGSRWEVVDVIVAKEYRQGFRLVVGEYLRGQNHLTSLIKVRCAGGRIQDCQIGSLHLFSGQASECVVTCRFASGRTPAQLRRETPRNATWPAVRAGGGSQQEVRREIAQELHQSMAQELFLCKARLIALRAATGERRRGRLLAEAIRFLDDTTAGFRTALSALSEAPAACPGLKDLLVGALRWARKKYGLDVTLRVKAPIPFLNGRAHDLVLASARELLTNVFKHSGQRTARVVIRPEGTGARLQVVDFGTGIQQSDVVRSRRGHSGLGLSGIRAWAEDFGGEVAVDSRPGIRTCVSVVLPYGGGP